MTPISPRLVKGGLVQVDPKTSQVSARPVTLGSAQDDSVLIADGLAGGETVVTAGVHMLYAGQKVRAVDKIPVELEVQTVAGASGKRILTFEGDLAPAEPPNVNAAVQPLAAPAGYLPLGAFGCNLVVPA